MPLPGKHPKRLKRRRIRGNTVLPAIFLSHMATSMFFAAVPDFLMEKYCSPIQKPDIDTICNNTHLVEEATNMASGRNIMRSLFPTMCVPIFAHWRDRTGNSKPLVIVGMVAETLAAVIYLISSLIWSLSPHITAYIESIVGGLFGETIALIGVNCIIIDNSTSENRTMRLQMLLSCLFLANCLGSMFYGFILSRSGYFVFYCNVVGLQLVAITLTVILVVDKKKPTNFRKEKGKLWQNLQVVFRARPNRAVLWMMMFSSALVETYSSAEDSIIVFYLQQAFHVTIIEEGIIDAYYALILAIGSIVFPYIFTEILNWTDYKIGIISALLTTVFESVRVFVVTKVELYLVVWLGLLKCVLFSIPQSIISKSVKNHELGKFLGMTAIIKCFISASINKLYALTFNLTSKTTPGAFFGIAAAYNMVILVLLSISAVMAHPTEVGEDTATEECENSPASSKRIDLWVIHKNVT